MYGLYYKAGQDMQPNWHYQPNTDLPPNSINPDFGGDIIKSLDRKNLPEEF